MKKQSVRVPSNRPEMEELVGRYADLQYEIERRTAEMDARIHAIRAEYEEDINTMTGDRDAMAEAGKAWALANEAEFGAAKSIKMMHGTVQWRLGNPTLRTAKGWTWDRVLDRLEKLPGMNGYVREVKEVNKQAILADRDILADKLATFGVRVTRTESFSIEPKHTELTPNQKAA